jgi:Flp pilus assembly pilin Flp
MAGIIKTVMKLMKREEGALVLEYGMAAIAVSACSTAGLTLSGSLSGLLF